MSAQIQMPRSDVECSRLGAIELKVRYRRYLDTKQCEAWRNIDLVSDMSEAGAEPNTGAAGFVAEPPNCVGKNSQPTVHHVEAAEVEPISATTAGDLRALNDVVRFAPGMYPQRV
jgi:hypothetical protein